MTARINLNSHRVSQLREDLEHLVDTGSTLPEAAERLGVAVQAIERTYQRAGLPVPGRLA